MRASFRVILMLAAGVIAGCGPSGSSAPVARLAGTVTVDGKPLPRRACCEFLPAEGVAAR